MLQDHFAQGHWGEFQGEHPFSNVELSKSLRKASGLQKRSVLPILRSLVKINATFEVAKLCALGNAQCKTRELPWRVDRPSIFPLRDLWGCIWGEVGGLLTASCIFIFVLKNNILVSTLTHLNVRENVWNLLKLGLSLGYGHAKAENPHVQSWAGAAEQGEKWEGWQLKIIFSYWKSKKGISKVPLPTALGNTGAVIY